MELGRLVTFYLPQYTCEKNCLFSNWMKERHWSVDTLLVVVNHHGTLLQYLLIAVVSCDRIIVICIQSRLG